MSARPRHHDIEVPFSQSLDEAFRRLTQRENQGRGFTFNNVRYEQLDRQAVTYLPSDAEGVVSLAFLDINQKIHAAAWGIEAVYGIVAETLVLAHRQRVGVTFDHGLSDAPPALPYEDHERQRLLRTSRPLPQGHGEPLSFVLKENATVYEESEAVRALISALNQSLFFAYHDDKWPVIHPQEVAALQNSLTAQKLRLQLERSAQRQELFGIKPHSQSRPRRSTR